MESCSDICDFVLRVMLVIYFSFLALDFFVKVIHNRFWQRIFFVISYCTDVYGDTHSHTDHTCHHNITSDLTAPLARGTGLIISPGTKSQFVECMSPLSLVSIAFPPSPDSVSLCSLCITNIHNFQTLYLPLCLIPTIILFTLLISFP